MFLKDVKVLDLSRVLAGPFATMYLAEFGAKVIKVEPPEGDETRQYAPFKDGVSTYFYSINRGKYSISLNLKTDKGREILDRLIRKVDVLIHNYRSVTAKKLGVDFERVSKINRNIIYVSIRGYDEDSSLRDYPAYDIIIQGLSGLMMATGKYGDDEPIRVGFALTDIFAGLYAASSIILALNPRVEKPIKIDVNLFDSLIYSMSYLIYSYILAGIEPERFGSGHPSIVPYQAFKCRDGKYIIVAAANNRQFRSLCKALKLEHLLMDSRYITNRDRVVNRDSLIKELSKRFSELDSDIWIDILRRFNVPVAIVNKISDMVESGYLADSGQLGYIEDPRLGKIRIVKPPVKINGSRPYSGKYSPALSEDSISILNWIGYSEDEIREFRRMGIVK